MYLRKCGWPASSNVRAFPWRWLCFIPVSKKNFLGLQITSRCILKILNIHLNADKKFYILVFSFSECFSNKCCSNRKDELKPSLSAFWIYQEGNSKSARIVTVDKPVILRSQWFITMRNRNLLQERDQIILTVINNIHVMLSTPKPLSHWFLLPGSWKIFCNLEKEMMK